MDDLIFRVVKPMTPYTNYTYLTTSRWCFLSVSAKTVSLDMSEDTNSTGDYSFWSPDHANRAGMFRNLLESENQQEIPTNCSPAALGNVSNGYDVSIQEHQPKLVLSDLW